MRHSRVGLLGGALGHAGGVAEGEDDGALVEGGHVADDGLCEGAGDRGHTCRTGNMRTYRSRSR